MTTDIFNSILSWYLKKRYHQIELFIKYPNEVQSELLKGLLDTAKNTELGRFYNFSSIKTYEDFRNRVPISSYEDIAGLIERNRKGEQNVFWPSSIKWFAKSSGTTNAKSKFIPVSEESLQGCHYNGMKDALAMYIYNNPDTDVFAGKSLRLGGSHDIYENNKTFFGDLSAILIENTPFWADFVSTPSSKVSLMGDWEIKMEAILNEVLKEDVRSLAGVPSWMLVLLNEAIKKTGKNNLLEIWPNLEVFFHGGVGFSPFKELYKNHIPKSDFKYYDVYNASEGFFAIQDRNYQNDMLLMLDYGIFYEFIPMDEFNNENRRALRLSEVELYKNYAIVITTNSGMWRYLIGDTVKFTSLSPYRIKISGRTKHFINTFGEELIIENSEEAIKVASKKTGLEVLEYSAGPVYMEDDKSGAHEWVIEFKNQPESIDEFAYLMDETLQALNSDYEAKRFNNMTLSAPKINVARKNLFYDWMKGRGKLGGQNKVPRLANNREYIDALLQLNNSN
ncbi:MAG: GH3 auxin-responsive promoter family protein [Ichthyobacteriaceae bacterium]|nr:GH3 auxin-responsive promoter family protein [Ichthyobacteriaceae bacterium]